MRGTLPLVPPPGAGFTTVMAWLPAAPSSALVSAAVRPVAPRYWVVRGLPSTSTVEAGTKPVPVTVRTKAPLPALTVLAEAGEVEIVAAVDIDAAAVEKLCADGGIPHAYTDLDRMLRDEFGVAQVIVRVKSNYSAPADPYIVDEIACWHAVVTGIGD